MAPSIARPVPSFWPNAALWAAARPAKRRSPPAIASRRATSAYRNSLALAIVHGLHSIAFPALSTGIYGYPKREAAEIAVHEVRMIRMPQHVIFCCFDTATADIYREIVGA